jgi:biotin carboxylase
LNTLADDVNRNIVVLVNDFYQGHADAMVKLSEILNRELKGIVLLDAQVMAEHSNAPDPNGTFEQIVVDFSDDAAIRAALKQFEDKLLAVTATADKNQPYLQRLLPFVPYLLGPTESSLTWSTHKAIQRRFMERYDPTLVPKYQMIQAPNEVEKALRRLAFPMIVKPTGLAASLLVTKVENENELRQAVSRSFAVLDDVYARDKGRGKPAMIVEEFMVGDMYTIDVYVNDVGRVWTLPLIRAHTAHTVGREGFYEYQADTHLELTEEQKAAGANAAIAAVHAMCLRSTMAHIEMYLTPTGWKIIELGPRQGGQRQDIYLASYGIDVCLNEWLLKIGLEPQVDAEQSSFSSTVYLYPDQEGVIRSIEGVEKARKNPSIYNLHVHGNPGDMALLSSNGGKWVVRGLLTNPDKDQLYRDLEAVRSAISIKTDPVSEVSS